MRRRRSCLDKTTQAVKQQIEAMGSRFFEVSLFKPAAAEEGKAVMIPRTWDVDTLVRSIPWLRSQNADGRNIYVRPKSDHDLSLVDDLTVQSVQRMKASGFTPAIVVETSQVNFQVWLKHPEVLPRAVSTMAARKLAEEFGGDRGGADWRHFGRLAGLTNRKTKYASEAGVYPFVNPVKASGICYPEGDHFATEVKAEFEKKRQEAESIRQTPQPATLRTNLKSIDEFRGNPRYCADGTRIDLAFAVYLLAHRADAATVSGAIRSRDLSHKEDEKRQSQYVKGRSRKHFRGLQGFNDEANAKRSAAPISDDPAPQSTLH